MLFRRMILVIQLNKEKIGFKFNNRVLVLEQKNHAIKITKSMIYIIGHENG